MGKNIIITPEYKESLEDLVKDYPSVKEYFDGLVCKEIGCSFEEMVCIGVLPEHELDDEEGWEIKSFFPHNAQLEITTLDENYSTEDFSIGLVQKVVYEGCVFVAETNASPYIIYANPKNL